MAFQPVPNTIQLQAFMVGVGQLANSEAQIGFYFSDGGAPTQTEVSDILEIFVTWLNTNYDTVISDDWHVIKATAKSLHVEGGPFAEEDLDIPGLLTGDPAPPSLAMYVRFKGTAGGSPLRGGVFLNVGNEAQLDGNNWLSGFRTTVDGVVTALPAAVLLGMSGMGQVIVGRYKVMDDSVKEARAALRAAIQETRLATAVTNTVASNVVRAQVASQRDRRGD